MYILRKNMLDYKLYTSLNVNAYKYLKKYINMCVYYHPYIDKTNFILNAINNFAALKSGFISYY